VKRFAEPLARRRHGLVASGNKGGASGKSEAEHGAIVNGMQKSETIAD
jgi:hypothetical protein